MSEKRNSVRFNRILVVDDTAANLQLLTNLLTMHGYTVYPASDGELALRFVQSIQPDIILLDIKMQGLDGYEVCHQLKAEEKTRSIPIIFISILEDEREKVKGFQAGAVDYITKPFQPEEVLARVKTHLRLQKLTKQLEQEVHQRTEELATTNQQLSLELAERRKAEALLRESEEKYRGLIQRIQAAVVVHGADTRILMSNPKAQQLLGLTHEQMMGKEAIDPDWHFFRENGTTMPLEEYPVNQVLTTGQPLRDAVVGIHRPGTQENVWGLVSADPVLNDHGKMTQVIVTFVDITERKRAIQKQQESEELLRRLNAELDRRVFERTAELKAANKEMQAFTYTVSHDLRAPLRHIDSFLELLQKKVETVLDKQSRHYIDNISEAANKMGMLIDDLLSFSRMGQKAMLRKQVDLGALVGEVIQELAPDAAGRDIEWRIGDLPTVGCDAAMLRIVLVNLILNALKFTRPRQQARIEIGILPGKNAEAMIFVRDNGVGFDMTYADKLFGVFQRLHHADQFDGTGIGLATVRRIITRHGGRTWAEGHVDQGATFYFSLPQASQGITDGSPNENLSQTT